MDSSTLGQILSEFKDVTVGTMSWGKLEVGERMRKADFNENNLSRFVPVVDSFLGISTGLFCLGSPVPRFARKRSGGISVRRIVSESFSHIADAVLYGCLMASPYFATPIHFIYIPYFHDIAGVIDAVSDCLHVTKYHYLFGVIDSCFSICLVTFHLFMRSIGDGCFGSLRFKVIHRKIASRLEKRKQKVACGDRACKTVEFAPQSKLQKSIEKRERERRI